jgi:hypothetical protein
MLKEILIITMVLLEYNFAPGQNIHKYCGTDIIPSPDNKRVIMIDKVDGEGGCFGYNSRLYKLPIDCNNFIQLNIFNDILWDNTSTRIITTKLVNALVERLPYVTSSIMIYDTTFKLINEINFASSPVFLGRMYFCREYDSINNIYTPMLYEYDFNTKEEKLIYKFDPSYTFWNEQGDDIITYPKLRLRHSYLPDGITGILYKRNNLRELYTFVVDYAHQLIFFKKGSYFGDNYLPNDGLIK